MQLRPQAGTCRQPPKTQVASTVPFDATDATDAEKDELIKACDKALEDCKTANSDKQAVINQQERVIVEQQNQLDECRQDQDSLWSKPWFTVTLGVVATLLILLVSGHTK